MRTILAIAVLAASASVAESPRESITLPITSPIDFFNLARNGSTATALCRDHQVRVWTLPEGKLLRTFDVGDQQFDVVVISDDGRLLLIGDHSGAVSMWDTSSGQAQWQDRLSRYPGVAVFSRDGGLLALAAQGDPVQVIDLASKRKLYELEPTAGGATALAFSRDKAMLAVAEADTTVRIYEVRSGKLLARNQDFLLEPLAIDFSADGKYVLAAGADKVLVFIDSASGRVVRRLEKTSEPAVYIEVSPSGDAVAAAFIKAANMSEPAPVATWDTVSGQRRGEWLPAARLVSGGWTRDGHLRFVTTTPEAAHIWQAP